MVKEWRKSRRGFFDEFDEELERMNQLINHIMDSHGGEPRVYGFSVRVGPDGVPHVEHFGNMGAMGRELNVMEPGKDVKEPFTSSLIDEKSNELKITAEMPGIRKDDIELNSTENEVTISADTAGRKYYKTISTPCMVDPESAKAKYNNGVLEITLKLKGSDKPKGKTVKIE